MVTFKILKYVPLFAFIFGSACISKQENTIFLNPDSLYLQAVEDAKVREIAELSNKLTPITKNNKNIVWNSNNKVLMNTLTEAYNYQQFVGKEFVVEHEIWATVAPELKNIRQQWNGLTNTELQLRFEQLIGLPPDSKQTYFLEFWADTTDIFRPCPDAEINDCSCELNFAENCDSLHRTWFTDLINTTYNSSPPYPFTGLGYTYDWHRNSTEFGVSEFVIKKGSHIHIERLVAVSEF